MFVDHRPGENFGDDEHSDDDENGGDDDDVGGDDDNDDGEGSACISRLLPPWIYCKPSSGSGEDDHDFDSD